MSEADQIIAEAVLTMTADALDANIVANGPPPGLDALLVLMSFQSGTVIRQPLWPLETRRLPSREEHHAVVLTEIAIQVAAIAAERGVSIDELSDLVRDDARRRQHTPRPAGRRPRRP
jgi:hypothetical protein